ncbi:ThiF family domain containing protein [Babesia bovis T2Bo]|uniref:ThiF family domain containing protein n=1 Tax=Babesia bovis T2Bo TaxID=484906 RepID=UPI001C35ED2C|nr:ThiF family domain containing protein [Babesia bovis T2Bo]EDO05196.2 ThiF family domain containing protein [Babesia bovis T2Bo]
MTIHKNVIVIGAGGLGCEVIKNIVLLGSRNITIVDPDIIEIHNITRQFLYKVDDVGKYKAIVAAERIKECNSNIKVEAITKRAQELPISVLKQNDIVITAVDNLETRRWINLIMRVIWEQLKNEWKDNGYNRESTLPMFVDGGSQELYGHVRVIKSEQEPCIECSMSLFVDKENAPSCSIPNKPKTAEDCIRAVIDLNWDNINNNEGNRNEAVIKAIFNKATQYASKHHVDGVTMQMVQNIVQNREININTTNAIIAAIILKVIMTHSKDNFYFYSGEGQTVLDHFTMEKQRDCDLCNCQVATATVDESQTIKQLITQLETQIGCEDINITTEKGTLYMSTPKELRRLYSSRLETTISKMKDMIGSGLYITSTKQNKWYYIDIQYSTNDTRYKQ